MQKTNNTTIHVRVDKDVAESFQRLYPHCRNRFIDFAMKLAVNDRRFFDSVFFKELQK